LSQDNEVLESALQPAKTITAVSSVTTLFRSGFICLDRKPYMHRMASDSSGELYGMGSS
jgi:hypothetical protein